MWIASLFPGVVGVVRWRASEPMITMVVKSTYELGSDRTWTRPQQLGLCRDHRLGWEDEGEVHYASDFAPQKPRADVLVVGHARAPQPARVIDVQVQVGRFSKRATALTPVPAAEVRLSSANLRAEQRATTFAARPIEHELPAEQNLLSDSDHARFNVAPSDQQLGYLQPAPKLVLEGLIEGAPRYAVRLPDHQPRVYVVDRASGTHHSLTMACDTLWIDVDQRLCTLCWRGSIPQAQIGADAFAAVAESLPWSRVSELLSQADWSSAVESSQLGREPPREHRVPLYAVEHDEQTMVLPDGAAPPLGRPIGTAALLGGGTEVLHSRELLASAAASLPPHLQAMLERLEKKGGASKSTAAVDPSAIEAPPLPFKPAAESAPPPVADEPTLTGEEPGPKTPPAGVRLGASQLGGAALVSDRRPEAMPFEPGEPAPREVRSSSPPAPAPPAVAATAPRTDVFDASALGLSEPLPFQSPGALPRAPGVSEDAEEPEQTRASTFEGASSPPLPFRRGAPGERPPPAIAHPGERAPNSGRTLVGAWPLSGAELPFARGRAPAAPAPPAPRAAFVPRPPDPIGQPSPPLDAPAVEEAPAESRDAEDSLPLSTYASIKVALLSGRPLAEVLEEHGLDPIAWRLEERRRSEELSRAAASGDLSVVHRLRGAMREARRRYEQERAGEQGDG